MPRRLGLRKFCCFQTEMVASPLHKQHFSLKTGVCLDDKNVKAKAYEVRIENDRVEIKV